MNTLVKYVVNTLVKLCSEHFSKTVVNTLVKLQ